MINHSGLVKVWCFYLPFCSFEPSCPSKSEVNEGNSICAWYIRYVLNEIYIIFKIRITCRVYVGVGVGCR